MLRLECKDLESISSIAQSIIEYGKETSIWLFEGEMGAGKTTLIKAICALLGVQEIVTSPTFSLVNEYEGSDKRIYHFDFYRINNLEEVMDMGYEEYFYDKDAYCFVEWASLIQALLPENVLTINIDVIKELRYISVS